MSVRERIGTLTDRLDGRLGRSFGRCRTCGRPTRSHRIGSGNQCHRCYVAGERIVATDGGQVPPARQCTLSSCDREAVDPTRPGALCSGHLDGDGDSVEDDEGLPREPQTEYFRSLDYTERVSGSFGEATDWGSWMPTNDGMGGKLPFAKYHDHPATEYFERGDADQTEKDPRHVWSDPSNWADFETVDEQVRMDPTLCERAFIMQRESDPATVSNDPPADPYIFADGDNVVDPATGAPIPEFVAAIEQLTGGEPTWQEFSTSDDGNHAIVRGRFPDGVRTRYIQLRDDPVKSYDEPPMLELYEGPKVAVLTGKRVAGAPETYADADSDGLQRLIDVGTAAHPNVLAAAKLRRKDDVEDGTDAGATDVGDAPAVFDPDAGPADAPDEIPKCYRRTLAARYETANHVTNLYAANLGIHAGYTPEECTEHFGLFPPARDESKFDERHTREELERTEKKADAGDLAPIGVEKLRETGFFADGEQCDPDCPIHGDPDAVDGDENAPGGDPVSALALARLEALDGHQRERYLDAVPDGTLVPTTDAVAGDIHDAVEDTLRGEGYTVIQAPTGSNKTGAAAETPWRDVDEAVTGDRPVVMFCETTDARDEALGRAREADLTVLSLKGYRELCGVARGDYDPASIDEDDPDAPEPIVVDGEPAGEWFQERVERRGVPISVAHTEFEAKLRQQGRECPCCAGELVCRTKTQWPNDGLARDSERVNYGQCTATASSTGEQCQNDAVDESGRCHAHGGERDPDEVGTEARYDLIVATDPFAFVPSLRSNTNVIHDEQPTYTEDFGLDTPDPDAITTRVRRAVTAFLALTDEGPDTFEELVELARACARCDVVPWNEHAAPADRPDEDLGGRWVETFTALEYEPDEHWYFSDPRAHTLAPALASAIWKAIADDVGPEIDPDERGGGVFDANGRATATVSHAPPRLDEDARDESGWNRTHVTVTITDENDVRSVRNAPDFRTARSVVGLDARPTAWLWQRNVHADMTVERVLNPDEAQRWRRYERGQTVVQVGDATRPAGKEGRYFNDRHARALIDAVREHFGADFDAAGTAKAIEHAAAGDHVDVGINELLVEAGVPEDVVETMTYGEEKSRNDFADKVVGLVYGCIDPGDDYVLDLLAECGLEAEPERSPDPCGDCEGDGCHNCDGTGRKRAHGRGFVGPDADHAAELLESVRATHVAQMIGRFGRALDVENGERNLTFVATDAVPDDLVDYEVPGVEWLATALQREIVETLRDRPRATTREIADAVGCSKKHVWETLTDLEERDVTERRRGVAAHGADEWRPLQDGAVDDVQLRLDEVVTSDVQGSCTWSVTVSARDSRHGMTEPLADGLPSPDMSTAGGNDPPDGGG